MFPLTMLQYGALCYKDSAGNKEFFLLKTHAGKREMYVNTEPSLSVLRFFFFFFLAPENCWISSLIGELDFQEGPAVPNAECKPHSRNTCAVGESMEYWLSHCLFVSLS